MATYKFDFKKPAQKFLQKRTPAERALILSAIYKLPDEGDVEPLQGIHGYRLRVGAYRAVFDRDDVNCVIIVQRIGNRGDVYKK
jgi:mRNA interferase RelE/StbE